MKNLKDKIKELREMGYSYNQIKKELNCSKSTVVYHLGEDQKLKALKRCQKRRSLPKNTIKEKVYRFNWSRNKGVMSKIRDFQRRDNSLDMGDLLPKQIINFTWEDFLLKIGNEHKCYLSGEPINIYNSKEYSIDHIIPASKNGDNSLENAGLISQIVNRMKNNLTVDEFIKKCIQIIEYNGYKVIKKLNGSTQLTEVSDLENREGV